jgi:hypothetical protein
VFAAHLYREIILVEIDVVPEPAKVSDEANSPELMLASSVPY